jgi:hypothetical protein
MLPLATSVYESSEACRSKKSWRAQTFARTFASQRGHDRVRPGQHKLATIAGHMIVIIGSQQQRFA